MKHRQIIGCFLFLFCLSGCIREFAMKGESSAIYVETMLPVSQNFIREAFVLPNDNIVLVGEIEQGAVLYLYNKKLGFLDTLQLYGRYATKAILEEDNTFTYVLDDGGSLLAYQVDFELNLKRSVNLLPYSYYPPGGAPQPHVVSKLDNGQYVFGQLFWFNNYTESKYGLFIISDIFGNPKAGWHYSPKAYDGRSIMALQKAEPGYFFASGYANGENFIDKFSNSGTLVQSISLPSGESLFNIRVEDDRYIYNDFTAHYILNHTGNLQNTVSNGAMYAPMSGIVELNGYYYYTIDVTNSSGKRTELRKTDKNFNIVKSKIFGNQNTNSSFLNYRHLLKQSTGHLILVAQVENPGVSGNHWMLARLDSELELVKQ